MKNAVLGLGGTVDYEVRWDDPTVQALAEAYGIATDELDRLLPIDSERDLVRTVLAFLRDGGGGERYVASSAVVEQFAARFDTRITLGGTCVRAALAMAKLDLPSTVHLVSIDDHVRRLLPAQVAYVCSAEHDSTDPHLIVQYPAGATVKLGPDLLRAPRPNRLIYTNDPPNAELLLSEALGAALAEADVFLVSGFNTIRDADMLAERLDDLRRHLRHLPAGALVVYEDAGFHVPALSALVRERLLDAVDLYGMNEDEMQAYVGQQVDLLDAPAMVGHLRALHEVVPARTLLVHSGCWALTYGPDSREWRDALRGGVTMAGARYALGDDFTAADYDAVGAGPVNAAGARFAAELEVLLGEQVCCVPALDLDVPRPTTIGLGDTFVGGLIAAVVQR